MYGDQSHIPCSDRGRSHKPSIHLPLHLGDRELRRRGGAYGTRLSVTTCTLVSRYVHLHTHATSIQSYVRGDKHLDLSDTTIHGVTEQTRPDMRRLHFRCWKYAVRTKSKCQRIPLWHYWLPKYPPPPDVRFLISDAENDLHIRPATSNSNTCSRATIPICTAAQNL